MGATCLHSLSSGVWRCDQPAGPRLTALRYVLCLLRLFISKYGSELLPPELWGAFLNCVLAPLALLFWTCPGLASGFTLDLLALVATACFRPNRCTVAAGF